MTPFTRWLGLSLLLGLAACSPSAVLNATVPSSGVTLTSNIPYEPGPRHTLDVYRPNGAAGPLPMVVFLYGGDWYHGDKDMYGFVGYPLSRAGAVVVVPDYRLAPGVAFPAFVQDNAAAVAWALSHARELGADPHRVFVMGHSAGAYNALMLALDPTYLAAAGTSRTALAGVIGLAGPYDFLPITEPELKPVFAPVNDGPLSQPIHYVDGGNPPLLLLAGKDDTTVNPRNTVALAAAVKAQGGPVEASLLPNLGHIGLITAFAPLFERRGPVLDDVVAFIRRTPPRA